MIDDTLAALADPTRRAAVELLRAEPRPAGALAKALELAPPAMSRHLKILRDAGLVEADGVHEDARIRVYRLRQAPFDELAAWVAEVEAFWSAELDAFAAHAERVQREST